ncbi:unnamed protein product [Rhizophagus irregularis]|nr:unnamed protein product [Rhizophagus irregularis]
MHTKFCTSWVTGSGVNSVQSLDTKIWWDLEVRLNYVCSREVRLICLNEFLNELALEWFPVYYFEVRLKYGRPEVRLIYLNEFLNELALKWFPVYQEINYMLELAQ